MLEVKYINQDENEKECEKEKSKSEKPLKDVPYDLNTCVFGDEYFFFNEENGEPKYLDIDSKWEIFIEWIKKVSESKKGEGEEEEYAFGLGQEVLKWAEQRDTFGMYILVRMHWVVFRDNYLTDDAPEIVREFIDGILYGKMTEEEKWGTDEDRKPKGQLIICSNQKMTPEESYKLTMKERRRKYDPKKHAERVKRDLEKMQEQMGIKI